ncbi:MAG: GNAT family N-acetyltransferase [Formivibrio sp.]|nr:GNAT family N-acetyltransferase [Formivibrio sp.]
MHIRIAGIEDCRSLQKIGLNTYREHFSDIWTEQGLSYFLERDFSEDTISASLSVPEKNTWLIASRSANGEPVGFAKINWHSPLPENKETGAELQKIYLLRYAKGMGIGKILVNRVFELALTKAEPCVWLDVLKTNKAAQIFYKHMGFNPILEIPFKTDIQDIGMIVMKRSISELGRI